MFKGNGSESDVDMEGQDARGIATRNVGSAGSAGPGPISRQGSVDHLHAETAEATEVPGERLNHHRGIAEPPDPASVADYEGLLIKFHSLNKDLDEERRLHRRTKVDLQHKEQEADEIFKDWKQATIELNKLRAQGQVHYEGTDEGLAGKAKQLRFSIRSLSYQHFADKPARSRRVSSTDALTALQSLVGYPLEHFEKSMQSSHWRPVVVQALVWSFLTRNIFHQFRWAGAKAAVAIANLGQVLGKHAAPSPPEHHT